MSSLPSLVDETNIKSILENIDNFMFDCDGVLWLVDELISGSNVSLNKLRALGKKIFYVSNNNTKSRDLLTAKCKRLGFDVEDNETVTPPYAIGEHLKNINFSRKIYAIGTEPLASELEAAGFKVSGIGRDDMTIFEVEKTFDPDPDVGAVVVGFDHHFSLAKIMRAASYLSKPDCLFIATNPDERLPSGAKGLVFPGTGTLVNAVEVCAARKADVLGKPSPFMFNVIKNKFNLDPSRTMMIGDRCNTDILFGKSCGLKTMLVLTGISTLEEVTEWSKSENQEVRNLVPDFYLPSIGDLANLLPK